MPADRGAQRIELLEAMITAIELGDDGVYTNRLARLVALEREAGEVEGFGIPARTIRLALPAAPVQRRVTPRCDQAEVTAFTTDWVTEADRARELHGQHDPQHDDGHSSGQWLAIASMYLGRAVYYAAWHNLKETRTALIKTVAMLFEGWRRMRQ